MGPVSQMVFCSNSNSMETSPCCCSISGHQIATEFCTCHDSTAVVSYAKFCIDHFEFGWEQNEISITFELCWNFFSEMGPWQYQKTAKVISNDIRVISDVFVKLSQKKKHCGNRIDHGRPCGTEFTLVSLYSTEISPLLPVISGIQTHSSELHTGPMMDHLDVSRH